MLNVPTDLKLAWKYDKVLIIVAVIIGFCVLGVITEGAFMLRMFREVCWCQEQVISEDAAVKAAYREIGTIRGQFDTKLKLSTIIEAVTVLNERAQGACLMCEAELKKIATIEDCFDNFILAFQKFKSDVEAVKQADAIRNVAIQQKLENLHYRLKMIEKMIHDDSTYNDNKE